MKKRAVRTVRGPREPFERPFKGPPRKAAVPSERDDWLSHQGWDGATSAPGALEVRPKDTTLQSEFKDVKSGVPYNSI